MAVRGKDVIVIGVEKRSIAKLQESRTIRKICMLDEHVCMAFAGESSKKLIVYIRGNITWSFCEGLNADARILIDWARRECQSHRLTVEDPVTLEYITRQLATIKQVIEPHLFLCPSSLVLFYRDTRTVQERDLLEYRH